MISSLDEEKEEEIVEMSFVDDCTSYPVNAGGGPNGGAVGSSPS